ncbi:DUF493 domain-containing protein [Salinisphaera sp. USBA-960]|uniref:YbeD family protein n=1 Tax=Salinisphaera orenii TaxID=856731 RepID=UPI000DBE58A1|nr:DUF493 domain-containing protein [Salifodinibacter halophilus]NNC26930.1 DUF493 domain-containing protein [Salifodinibacter halophilus]
MNDPGETLLEFPCQFAIKAFGNADGDGDFSETVYALVKPHAPDLQRADLKTRDSSRGRYVSVTATIRAESKAQLDAIYTDLGASPSIIMSL